MLTPGLARGVGRTKRSHLGRSPSAGGIQDERADMIAIDVRTVLRICLWVLYSRAEDPGVLRSRDSLASWLVLNWVNT